VLGGDGDDFFLAGDDSWLDPSRRILSGDAGDDTIRGGAGNDGPMIGDQNPGELAATGASGKAPTPTPRPTAP
jgi:hypothetical protein